MKHLWLILLFSITPIKNWEIFDIFYDQKNENIVFKCDSKHTSLHKYIPYTITINRDKGFKYRSEAIKIYNHIKKRIYIKYMNIPNIFYYACKYKITQQNLSFTIDYTLDNRL